MPAIKLPRYMRAKPLRTRGDDGRLAGVRAYYWELPTWAKPPAERWGRPCPVSSEALGTDLAAAIGKADLLNAHLDQWRVGVDAKPAEGTVKALFAWYRGHERFKELGFRTQIGYRANMDRVEAFQLKTTLFGDRRAAEIEAQHADAMYRALVKKHGKRTGGYCMQVCRRVWNEAIRAKKSKAPNPYSRMGIKIQAEHGNQAATREQYDAFREKARAMGYQSMATAAAISFELLRRVTDVMGFEFPGRDPDQFGFFWEGYKPGHSFAMRQGKTGTAQVIPLRGDPDPESEDPVARAAGPLLYLSLEEELARHDDRLGHIVVYERTGKRYKEREATYVFKKIRAAAGLPTDLTLTSFRHGGATELGDAGIYDIRPISGHRTLHQTTTYNKATQAKARRAGEARIGNRKVTSHE